MPQTARARHFVAAMVISLLLLIGLTLITTGVHAATPVGGPIISDTTWTQANSPYIVTANVEVWDDVTLTIEPGVMVRFSKDTRLSVNGELIAQGTANLPITFTSNEPAPAPGDWDTIEFTTVATKTTMDGNGNYISGSVLRYCVVEYAGGGAGGIGGAIIGRSLLIDHCTIKNNEPRGIRMYATASMPGWISNSSITHNTNDIYQENAAGIYAEFTTIANNTIASNIAQSGHGGGIYAKNSTITDNRITGNEALYNGLTGYGYSGGGIYATESVIANNYVAQNKGMGGGGGIYANNSTISGNTVVENYFAQGYFGGGGGISAGHAIISGNLVSGNRGGLAVSYSTVVSNTIINNQESGIIGFDTNTILTNTIASNEGRGATIMGNNTVFSYNSVIGNRGPDGTLAAGLVVNSGGGIQVHYNNLYSNYPYDVTVNSQVDIDGTSNYWGTVSTVNILSQIYDWYDDDSRGRFLYIPYLQEPSPDAPFPPPTGLMATFDDEAATLSWDEAPSFTTGWGYKIYYDTDSSLPPFDGMGLDQGNAPIDVGAATVYTLTGLEPNNDYYFAVTVYDNQGRESWYSNVILRKGGSNVFIPFILKP